MKRWTALKTEILIIPRPERRCGTIKIAKDFVSGGIRVRRA